MHPVNCMDHLYKEKALSLKSILCTDAENISTEPAGSAAYYGVRTVPWAVVLSTVVYVITLAKRISQMGIKENFGN